ncbi:MAG: hypothetical protein LC115_00355 [Bacteroidia bacterium]|nr:hypothetical protein [Bacteroidia bacterium]
MQRSLGFLFRIVIGLVLGSSYCLAQIKSDSIAVSTADSVSKRDSTAKIMRLDSLKSASDIKDQVKYAAQDSIVLDLNTKKMWLYSESSLDYDGMRLKSEFIDVDWPNNMVEARGAEDSTGKWVKTPIFVEKGQEYRAERMRYNFSSRKGIIYKAKTNQGGDYILGQTIRRNPDNTYYIASGEFTTCDAEHPHFSIHASKLKVIPGDKIICGPLYLRVADVPLPLVLPFGFFPNQQRRKSGIVIPAYGEAADRGFFLRGGGFFWAASPYLNATFEGDIFTKGGYRIGTKLDYKKRYVTDGNLNFNYAITRFNEPTDPNFQEVRNINIVWNHNQILSPTAQFRANVNAASPSYFRNNSFNIAQVVNTQLASSISYQKSFRRAPALLSVSMNSNQNLATRNIELSLPSANLSVNRFNPFKKKNASQNAWYEQISVGYNVALKNVLNTYDSLLLKPETRNNMRNGMLHTASINTNFKLLRYVTLSPSATFNEYWYLQTTNKTWVNAGTIDSLKTDKTNGFAATRDFSLNMAANTNVYGVFQTQSKRKRAFRHTLNPSVSYTYRPDFGKSQWGVFKSYRDSTGTEIHYSRFENGIIGSPAGGESQAINFGLRNMLEMKSLNKKTDPNKSAKDNSTYTTLLDNLSLSTRYNFAADSFRIDPLRANARTSLLKGLFVFNLDGSFNWYALNEAKTRVTPVFLYTQNKQLARLTSASAAISCNLKSPKKKEQPEKKQHHYQSIFDQYQDFSIPWTLNLSYTLNYDRPLQTVTLRHALTFSGNITLTPKWGISYSSGLDFKSKKLTVTSINITRDLHCWQMTLNIIPFGTFRSYFFTLNVKSSTLADLKINKQRNFQDRFSGN